MIKEIIKKILDFLGVDDGISIVFICDIIILTFSHIIVSFLAPETLITFIFITAYSFIFCTFELVFLIYKRLDK